MRFNKLFALIGLFVTLGFLFLVARNRLNYITANDARVDGVAAAGIGLLASLVGLVILYLILEPILPKSLQLFRRNKS